MAIDGRAAPADQAAQGKGSSAVWGQPRLCSSSAEIPGFMHHRPCGAWLGGCFEPRLDEVAPKWQSGCSGSGGLQRQARWCASLALIPRCGHALPVPAECPLQHPRSTSLTLGSVVLLQLALGPAAAGTTS